MRSPSYSQIIRMTVVMFGLALIAAACGDSDSDEPTTQAPGESSAATDASSDSSGPSAASTTVADDGPTTSGDPVKIGVWVDLTGNLAPFDTTYEVGARLAVDAVNAAGGIDGRPLELIFEDMGNDPQKAIQVFEKLTSQNVVAYMGGVSSQGAAALAPMFAETGKTGLVGATLGEGTVGMYSMTPPLGMDASIRIAFLEEHGVTKVGLLTDPTPYNKFLVATIVPALEAAGIEVVGSEEHPLDVVDLRPQIQKLLNADAGAILKLSAGPSDVVAAKAMAQADTDAMVLYGPESTVVITQAAEAYSEIYWLAWPIQVIDALSADDTSEALAAFATAFEGNDADPGFAAQAWDAVFVLADVLNRADDFEPETIAAILNALPIVEGASSTYDFRAPGLAVTKSPYYVGTIVDGLPTLAARD